MLQSNSIPQIEKKNRFKHNQTLNLQQIIDMRASPSFCLLMAVMLLLHEPVAALNWQGTGELNNDNLTYIWAYIHANLAGKVSSNIDSFAQDFSTALNAQWAPAWNVILILMTSLERSYNDAILYGYAFRNHWMWFNGYQDQSILSRQFSFLIWKDYNCQGWKTVGQNGGNGEFSTSQQQKIANWISSLSSVSLIQNDPWTLAKSLVDAVQADSDFVVGDNHAYSAILTQDYDYSFLHGRVCEVGKNHYYTTIDKGSAMVSGAEMLLLFQTR